MKTYIKINKNCYDELAEEYKNRLEEYKISDRKIAFPFIEYLKKEFNKIKVLELGPGSGLNLLFLEDEGFQTTGIDISNKIISFAKEVSPKTNFIQGDFLEYNFGESKFDGIFAKAFIHLFPKKDAVFVLNKIWNLLKLNGAAFIATTVHDKSEEGYFEKLDYSKKLKRFRKKWTEQELINEIDNIGFKIFNKSYNIEHNKNKKWVNLVVIKSIS